MGDTINRDPVRDCLSRNRCPVEAAMAFGDADSDGAGYWLVLTLTNGQVLTGPAWAPRNGLVAMQVFHEGVQDLMREPVTFIRTAEVAAASVDFS